MSCDEAEKSSLSLFHPTQVDPIVYWCWECLGHERRRECGRHRCWAASARASRRYCVSAAGARAAIATGATARAPPGRERPQPPPCGRWRGASGHGHWHAGSATTTSRRASHHGASAARWIYAPPWGASGRARLRGRMWSRSAGLGCRWERGAMARCWGCRRRGLRLLLVWPWSVGGESAWGLTGVGIVKKGSRRE